MNYSVEVTSLVKANPARVYAIIADYHEGHPQIIPKPPFVFLRVEEGGIGAGTKISFQMKIFGRSYDFRATVTEPDPGRVLVETNYVGGGVSTFTVNPVENGKYSEVTIHTSGETQKQGLLGTLERVMTCNYLRRVYRKELALLEAVAKNHV